MLAQGRLSDVSALEAEGEERGLLLGAAYPQEVQEQDRNLRGFLSNLDDVILRMKEELDGEEGEGDSAEDFARMLLLKPKSRSKRSSPAETFVPQQQQQQVQYPLQAQERMLGSFIGGRDSLKVGVK